MREKLHFYPDDSSPHLAQTRQARRWLYEMNPKHLTPMHRVGKQDFYIFEICRLTDRTFCMPFRWYTCRGRMRFYAWQVTSNQDGWFIDKRIVLNHGEELLDICYPDLQDLYLGPGLPPIDHIVGKSGGDDRLTYKIYVKCCRFMAII